MPMESTVAERGRIVWLMRLHSAFRTASACAIVGGTTLYGPESLRTQIKFPAFCYLTAILIVGDATLGDTLRGFWHAIYATIQVVPLSMLSLWILGPGLLSTGVAALAVALSSFLVALPESTHLTSKRIAFGQIVVVFTASCYDNTSAGFMHPLYVASSTGLGAMSSVLALLLPYSWLASYEVRKLCRVYAENASERMNLYLKAFSTHNNQTKMELISQAKPFAETGSKILHSIRILQPGMQWERPCSRYWKPDFSPGERLQRMEMPMRGIENALISSPAFPVRVVDQEELSNVIQGVSVQLRLKTEQARCFLPFNSMTAPETGGEFIEKILLPLELISTMKESVLFFFSCIEMFLDDSTVRQKPESTLDTHISPGEVQTQQEAAVFGIRKAFRSWIMKLVDKERLVFASKCSLSLGLAVLFGLMFNKENGCWSGLSIAISFVTGRHAVFTIANTRAQGTAIGSVYGVLCCFLFQNYTELRFLALLPWIIFTGFLRHSRMYGQTGGTSSAIGALLILGRKNYGTPNEFAIIRLTEVLIGLSCFIVVELFMQPTRAATLAKSHLHLSLITLQDCIKHVSLYCGQKDQPSSTFHEFREKQENLKSLVCELERSTADAESEPDFWYLPFRSSCYQKLVGSLSNIVVVLYFITYNLKILSELPVSCSVARGGLQEHVNNAMGHFQETLSSSLRCLEMATLTESFAVSKEPDEKIIQDLEEGKLQNQNAFSDLIMEDGEAHKILRYAEDVEKEDSEGKKELRGRMVICSGALGFCISILRKEIKDFEIGIKELAQWEYHSRQ
ncbi:hypothetical protein Fot_36747 [Forsythia ovata]|uniref:Integral membrane bound transporter domain-containing protein n=1 Tax=Forsythia ovata TaxID=205694 RepID=A0ABD1SSW6_9LAMI